MGKFAISQTITPYVMSRRHNTEVFPDGRLSADFFAKGAPTRREPLALWGGPSGQALVQGGTRKRDCLPTGSCAECHTNFCHHDSNISFET